MFYLQRDLVLESSAKKLAALEAELDEKDARRKEMAAASGDVDMSKVLPMDFRPKKARFGAFKESNLKPVTMKNTEVMDVFTPRVADPVTKGRAYIYYNPLSQTKPAIIHLSDPQEKMIITQKKHPNTKHDHNNNTNNKPPNDMRVD